MSNPRRNDAEVPGQVFTFFSTASATGKTTLALNVAADLAERGFKVCLVDTDMQFGDLSRYMKLQPTKTFYDFSIAEPNKRNVDDFLLETEFKFDVLPAPIEVDEGFLMDAPSVHDAISQLRSTFDYVIIDTATGFSEINLGLLDQTDVLYLPCVVDFIPSIKNLKIGLETLHRFSFDSGRMRLILNRNKAETEISVKDVEGLLGKNFQYFISNDYKGMMEAIKKAVPVVLSDEQSIIGDDISNMVAAELGEKEEKSGGLGGWLSSLWG